MADLDIPIEREALTKSVERIVASPVLRSSESLCNLLRYLARQATEHLEVPPKEYQIAIEVFGRSHDFDSRMDSTVRVQTGRLRSKLVEYYAGAGREDNLVLGIPKGSYSLSIERRNPPAPPLPFPEPVETVAELPAAVEPAALVAAPRTVGMGWFLGLAALLVAAVGVSVWWSNRTRSEIPRPSDAARMFWQVFLANKQPPFVVFSNAEFIGTPTRGKGMRYFDPATDSGGEIRDHYTGIGEVFAVHQLDQLFARFGSEIHLKRGRLLAWDDARGANLIFLGSTVENLSLRELPGQRDFVFKLSENPERDGTWEILNLRPGPGEKPSYPGSVDLPTTQDHALIALLPAPEPNRFVLILAGTTTLGTQAATDFVCRPESLEILVSRLHLADPAHPVPFEALIRAEISGSVPVRTEIVALHPWQGRRP